MEGPATSRKMLKAEARRVVLEQLAKVGMAERADAYPNQLSGARCTAGGTQVRWIRRFAA